MLFKNIALLAVATASIVAAAPVAIDGASGSDLAAINANVPDVSTYGLAARRDSDSQGDEFLTKAEVKIEIKISPEEIAEIVKKELEEPIARLGLTVEQGIKLTQAVTEAVIKAGAKSVKDVDNAVKQAIVLFVEKVKDIEQETKSNITKAIERIKIDISNIFDRVVRRFIIVKTAFDEFIEEISQGVVIKISVTRGEDDDEIDA